MYKPSKFLGPMIKEKRMTLEKLRAEILSIDRELIRLIHKRMLVSIKIGKLKRKQGLSLRNYRQERLVLQSAKICGKMNKLSTRFIASLMKRIIQESKKMQSEL